MAHASKELETYAKVGGWSGIFLRNFSSEHLNFMGSASVLMSLVLEKAGPVEVK